MDVGNLNFASRLQLEDRITDMVPIHYAYHVTSTPASDICPRWDRLNYYLASDPIYDGPLLGLPCVFFTTTLCRNNLPDKSPYPVGGVVGESYYRVRVPIENFNNYKMWLCDGCQQEQIRLVLTNKESDEILVQNCRSIKHLEDRNQYLCRIKESNETYWLSNDCSNKTQNFTVSFAILHDFEFHNECLWDTVEKTTMGAGHAITRESLCEIHKRNWLYHVTNIQLKETLAHLKI